jgi:hypothetical protein
MRCVPKLTDFGLARRPVEGDVNDLDLQQGLPSYLSPEQVWGRAKDIGPATDVYALGAILYELVSGEPPFLGPTLSDTLDLIQTRPAPPPGKHRAGVPADLGAVCLKCLDKSPRKRYASAEALADDLRRFLDGLPVKARKPGPVGRAWRAARRRPAVALLLALTLGLAAALALVTARPGRARPAPATVVPGVAYPRPPQSAPVAPVVERRDDPETVYYRSLALAQRAASAGDRDCARRYLERCPATCGSGSGTPCRNRPAVPTASAGRAPTHR